MNIVAANLKRIIDEKGYIIKKVAEKAEMPEGKFYNIINGRTDVRADMIPVFCRVLEVEPNELFAEHQNNS